jgi:hypothetical protein
MNSARSRWEQQERDHLAREIGPDRADEWISVLRDLATASPGTELVTIWDAIRFARDVRKSGDLRPRGDSGSGAPDLAGLITDLALVLEDAARRDAGLPAQNQHAMTRLRSALGWAYGENAAEIAGRLAVALAKAQGEPAPRGDPDPVRQAAQRLTADVLRLISDGDVRLAGQLENEIRHAAEIWIESACMTREA